MRGNRPAKIDDKGRLKLPTVFRSAIAAQYGDDVFVTSTDGKAAVIYPLRVWTDVEAQLAQAPSSDPRVRRYKEAVNYYGQEAAFDKQGRVLIQGLLRERAEIVGEVMVLGLGNHLEVWNKEHIGKRQSDHPLTAEELGTLAADYGI